MRALTKEDKKCQVRQIDQANLHYCISYNHLCDSRITFGVHYLSLVRPIRLRGCSTAECLNMVHGLKPEIEMQAIANLHNTVPGDTSPPCYDTDTATVWIRKMSGQLP